MLLHFFAQAFKKPGKAYLDWLQPQNKKALVRGIALTFITMTGLSIVDHFYYADIYYRKLGITKGAGLSADNYYRLLFVPLFNLVAALLANSKWNNTKMRFEALAAAVLFISLTGLWSSFIWQGHYKADDYTYEVLVLILFSSLLYGLSFRASFILSALMVLSVLLLLAYDDRVELELAIYDASLILLVWVPVMIGTFKLEQAMAANFRAIVKLEEANHGIMQQAMELKSKNQDLEQFAYASSHDLQEPLRTISNFVAILNKQLNEQMAAEQRLYMDLVLNSTDRMKNLIHALLDYSRIGRNKQLERVDCNEMLKEVIMDLDYSIRQSNATVKVGDLPVIVGFRAELATLFQNLISNALKFRQAEVPPFVQIDGSTSHDGYLFSVKDNGIGIDPKYADKIFQLFSRLHNKDEYEGTGIGLTHSKKIVELHGGRIWVEARPGSGAIFYFILSNTLTNNSNEKEATMHYAY
jgi:signal transduction histidine kinase